MGNNVDVSVIIPVYNTEKYLRECIDSILNQTSENIELVCVDDMSADRSWEILCDYAQKDTRLKLYRTGKPSGSAAKPRNIGLEHAIGEYVIFLDSDDYFDSSMIEKMLTQARRLNSDLVLCDNYRVTPDKKLLEGYSELYLEYIPILDVFSYKDIPDDIFQISNAAGWHRLVRRDLVNEHDLQYQEGCPILDDIYFVNSVLVYAKRISVLNEKLMYYRMEREGAQTLKIEKYYDSIFKAFDALIARLKRDNIYDVVEVSLKNWILKTMAWWYGCVNESEISEKLYALYKTNYFDKWGINKLYISDVIEKYRYFFIYIMLDRYNPPFKAMLRSKFCSNERIVLYGAGKVGKRIYKIIQEDGTHKISLWCDKNYEKFVDLGVDDPELINSVQYDIVIIAIRDEQTVHEVTRYLTSKGIKKEKIYHV